MTPESAVAGRLRRAIGLSIVLLGVLGGCSAEREEGQIVVGLWSGQNVLPYAVDTMRADLLEPHGCPDRFLPEILRLARQGVLFEECLSVSTWTRPDAASLLTSRPSPAHGVVEVRPEVLEELRALGYVH